MTSKVEPTSYGGHRITRSDCKTILTVDQHTHVTGAMAKWLPGVMEGKPLDKEIPQGKQLRDRLDALKKLPDEGKKMTKPQKDVQSINGDLRWMTLDGLMLIKPVHQISCVSIRSDGENTLNVAKGVLYEAYKEMMKGDLAITFGGCNDEMQLAGMIKNSSDSTRGPGIVKLDGEARLKAGAPKALDTFSDTTWAAGEKGDDDLYAHAHTLNGGAVHAELKKSTVITGSSAEMEGIGNIKATDKSLQARNACRVMRKPQLKPTVLNSDSESSLRAAMGNASAVRLKHVYRRYALLGQRVQAGDIRLAHVDDEYNMVDFMTKWTTKQKVQASLAYLTGKRARDAYGTKTLACVATMSTIADMLTQRGA